MDPGLEKELQKLIEKATEFAAMADKTGQIKNGKATLKAFTEEIDEYLQ